MLTCFLEVENVGTNAVTAVYDFQMAQGYSQKLFALQAFGTELENIARILEKCDHLYDTRAADLRTAESHFSHPNTMHDTGDAVKLNDIHIQ